MKGEDIPLLSRIITVVDAYDAMISEISHRKALSKSEAGLELIKYKNTQFDAKIADLFIKLIHSKK